MATTFRLEEGGLVTVAVGPTLDDSDNPRAPRLLRLEAAGRGAMVSTVFLHGGEVRELVVELLRRQKGGDDVARFPGWRNSDGEMPVISLDRLVNLVCGETVAPAPPAREEGEPT